MRQRAFCMSVRPEERRRACPFHLPLHH
jgi:hypothetical protein